MLLLPLLFVLAASPQLGVLKTELPVWDVAASDLDGNGKADILALCSDPEKLPLRKQLAVFLAEEGGYPSAPSFTLPLATETGGVFLAEIDGTAPTELAVTYPEGARIYSYADKNLKAGEEVKFTSLLPSHVEQPVFLKSTASDFNGDGKDEWLVPVATGFEIHSPGGMVARVEADMNNSVESGETNRITHRIPSYTPFQLPDQPLKGLAFMSDKYVDYAYGNNWSEHARFKVPLDLKEKWVAEARMSDIDGNGLPDLVVTQTQGTVNIKGLTQVYFAKEPFTFSETPDVTFPVNGALSSPLVKDVNGDGKSDLLFIKVPFGVKMIMNYLMSQRLSLTIEAHLLKDGNFAVEPDMKSGLTVDAPENRKRVAYALGDFNGDKWIDLAFGSGAAQMVFYTGTPERLLSSKPWQTLDVPSIGEARPYKLNGGEAEDLVIFHPSSAEEKRIDVIVF